MNFLLYISLFFVSLSKPTESIDLMINSYSLSSDTLILKCSINNGTSTVHSVYLGDGWSTIPEFANLTLFILENDTLALHIANPFGGYPTSKYDVVKPYGKRDIIIRLDLKHLYKFEHILFQGTPHPLASVYSFQLIYYDRLFQKNKKAIFKAYLDGKRVRQHIPVSDILRSNIVYIDMQKHISSFDAK